MSYLSILTQSLVSSLHVGLIVKYVNNTRIRKHNEKTSHNQTDATKIKQKLNKDIS